MKTLTYYIYNKSINFQKITDKQSYNRNFLEPTKDISIKLRKNL